MICIHKKSEKVKTMFRPLHTRDIGVIMVVLALVAATFGVLSAAPAVPPATVDASLRALA